MSSSPISCVYLTGPEHGAIEIIAQALRILVYSGGALTQEMSVSLHGGSHGGNDIMWCNSATASRLSGISNWHGDRPEGSGASSATR